MHQDTLACLYKNRVPFLGSYTSSVHVLAAHPFLYSALKIIHFIPSYSLGSTPSKEMRWSSLAGLCEMWKWDSLMAISLKCLVENKLDSGADEMDVACIGICGKAMTINEAPGLESHTLASHYRLQCGRARSRQESYRIVSADQGGRALGWPQRGVCRLRRLKLWHPLGTHRQVSNCRRKFVRQQPKKVKALHLRNQRRCVNNESVTLPWVKSVCLKDTSRPFEEVWMTLCNKHNLNVKISRWLNTTGRMEAFASLLFLVHVTYDIHLRFLPGYAETI